MEIKVTIEAVELAGAINNLAAALSSNKKSELNTPALVNETNSSEKFIQPEPPQVPVQQPAVPVQPPVVQTAPAQKAEAPVPTVPVAQPQQYTLDPIMQAGTALMDAGKMNELRRLLQTFGVKAVTQLKSEQLGAFATALRGLGAKI